MKYVLTALFSFLGILYFSSIHAAGVLPDQKLTPGAIYSGVTQENLSQTICNPQWSTKSIRPPSSYTTGLKIQQIMQYGYADKNKADYEEDHLISLELGGNPTDPKNLWPESYNTTPNARDKDRVENYLHAQVCSGAMTLAQAQRIITTDWTQMLPKVNGKFGSIETSSTDDP